MITCVGNRGENDGNFVYCKIEKARLKIRKIFNFQVLLIFQSVIHCCFFNSLLIFFAIDIPIKRSKLVTAFKNHEIHIDNYIHVDKKDKFYFITLNSVYKDPS